MMMRRYFAVVVESAHRDATGVGSVVTFDMDGARVTKKIVCKKNRPEYKGYVEEDEEESTPSAGGQSAAAAAVGR